MDSSSLYREKEKENEESIEVEINENNFKSKINNISLINLSTNTILYCQSFENLIKIQLGIENEVKNIENFLFLTKNVHLYLNH